MSKYEEWKKRLSLVTTKDEDMACLFLESEGQRFLYEFGTKNAIEKAQDILWPFMPWDCYVQCGVHGATEDASCIRCVLARTHNAEVYRELAAANGWMLAEPSGDVPMAVA